MSEFLPSGLLHPLLGSLADGAVALFDAAAAQVAVALGVTAPAELVSQARGLLGAGNWLANTSRVDLAILVNLGQQVMGSPSVGDLRRLNVIVRRAKQWQSTGIRIPSIP